MPLESIRLPAPSSYTTLSRKGRRVRHASGEIELRVLMPAPDGASRMAVRLRAKNGCAPYRNTVRRQLRELLRSSREAMPAAWLLWCFPPAKLKQPPVQLREAARSCLVRAGVLPS